MIKHQSFPLYKVSFKFFKKKFQLFGITFLTDVSSSEKSVVDFCCFYFEEKMPIL